MKTQDFPLPARLSAEADMGPYAAMRKAVLAQMAELESQRAALSLAEIFRKRCELEVFCVFNVSVYDDEGYHDETRAMSNRGDNLDPDDGVENDLLDAPIKGKGEGQNPALHSELSRWARSLPPSAFERLSGKRIRRMEGDLTDTLMSQLLEPGAYARWQAGAIEERVGEIGRGVGPGAKAL